MRARPRPLCASAVLHLACSKNISHATLSTKSPFPQVQIIHGNLFLTLGHTIRPPYDPTQPKPATAAPSTMELLPEEALYLLERGTLQIWCHPSAYDPSLAPGEDLVWNDAHAGFDGCVEMSAMEAFSRFIGRDGLTLERYQVRFLGRFLFFASGLCARGSWFFFFFG